MQGRNRYRVVTMLSVFGVISLFMIPLTVIAQTATPNNIGGSTIYVFCLDYGKNFPQGRTIMAQGLADDRVRGALSYALGKGYVTSDPYEVQLAIWNLHDGQPFHDINNRGTARAQEIVMNAGTVPAGNASDVGNLTISNITPADANDAYGTGTVSGMLPANSPIGFVLPAPDASFQSLVSVVASPAAATANTPAATAASPTPASAPASAPTNTPAPTVAPTGTPAPAPTATCTPAPAPTTVGGNTPTARAGTAAATAASGVATTAAGASATCAPTPTGAPIATATCVSSAAATGSADRTTPTTFPTVRAAATNATGASPTCTAPPVATGTGGGTTPTTLPTTGAPRDPNGGNTGLVLSLTAALLVIGAGILLLRRPRVLR